MTAETIAYQWILKPRQHILKVLCTLFCGNFDIFYRLLTHPMSLGSWVNLFDWRMSFCNSRSLPISLGTESSLFSSRSRMRSLGREPIVTGSFLSALLDSISTWKMIKNLYSIVHKKCRNLRYQVVHPLIPNIMLTSSDCSSAISSGSLLIWLVPRFSSTNDFHVPMSIFENNNRNIFWNVRRP